MCGTHGHSIGYSSLKVASEIETSGWEEPLGNDGMQMTPKIHKTKCRPSGRSWTEGERGAV